MTRPGIRPILFALLILASALLASPNILEEELDPPEGWFFPSIGAGNGEWDASVGVFFWTDTLELRNLQVRGDMDFARGVRGHAAVRSNRELDTLSGLAPNLDELYVEAYGFRRGGAGTFSGSLRVGAVRYLRFPYPDAIAVFDQVPGVSDLLGGADSGYVGEILTLDYAWSKGVGAHLTGYRPDFGRGGDAEMIEAYLSCRGRLGSARLEARAGRLAVRPEPLGRGASGFNVFLGIPVGEYTLGALYEDLQGQPAYTGVMVRFPSNRVTRALGKVAFDYDRRPEGFSAQIPLTSGNFGRVTRAAPEKAALVGQMTAERLRTYWQNGQVRNYYEHRLGAWGETDARGLIVVMKEEPWYLQAEALVSPHTELWSWEDLKAWESDRSGPAQLCQKVRYEFYRPD